MSLKELVTQIKNDTEPSKVQPDHKPTANERNNLCYLSMKYISGWGMRACDLAVVEMMAPNSVNMDWLDKEYIPVLAEYMWDHLMGEPADPTVNDVEEAVRACRDHLFGMPQKIREDVG